MVDMEVQESEAASYRPPSVRFPDDANPPHTISVFPVHPLSAFLAPRALRSERLAVQVLATGSYGCPSEAG
jgi:hypothetical protein